MQDDDRHDRVPQHGEGAFDRVQATGAEVVQEPMDQSYGRDCAFRDPAGNMIRIIQTRG